MRLLSGALALVVCLGAGEAFAQYCPNNGPGSPPDTKPKKRESNQICGSRESVGDPVNIFGVDPYTYDVIEDLAVSTPTGELSLRRSYVSNDGPWKGISGSAPSSSSPTAGWRLSGIPKPFGQTRVAPLAPPVASMRWSHNFFAFVDDRDVVWFVKPPRGSQEEFAKCSSLPCWATPTISSPGQQNRLYRAADGTFTFYQDDGKIYKFESPNTGATMYFLTRIVSASGTQLASVSYAELPGCPSLGNGVPYVNRVSSGTTLGGGPALQFTYSQKGSPVECVLTSVNVVGSTVGVTYTYQDDLPGHLSSASTPEFVENYSAYNAGFEVQRAGSTIVSHSGANVLNASDRFGAWTIPASLSPGSCSGLLTCCSSPYGRSISVTSARTGDGSNAVAGLLELYSYSTGENFTRHQHEPVSRTDSCSALDSCSPGSVRWLVLGATDTTAPCVGPVSGSVFNPGYVYGTKDKLGNWVVTPNQYVVLPGGGGNAFEQTALWRGVPSEVSQAPTNGGPNPGVAGANALERTTYTYKYFKNQQYLDTETRPSSITGSVQIKYVRNSFGRPTAMFISGTTKNLAGTNVPRVVAMFTTYDAEGRITEENGPCEVSNTSATACLSWQPRRTVRTYYPPSSGLNTGQLFTVSRYRDWTQALVTTFASYNALGQPGQITDENGIVTNFTYQGHQLLTRQVMSGLNPTWTYGWENEKLVSIAYPGGNSETFCYRSAAPPSPPQTSDTCSGTWTGRLQRRMMTDGANNWSEATTYRYREDNTLAEEISYACPLGGSCHRSETPVERFRTAYAADAHRRPTYQSTGLTGTFQNKRAYDGADNLIALGPAYNNVPSYCRATPGGALSAFCSQQMTYDRANRIRQLDIIPNPATSPAVKERVCVDYDQQGRVNKVTNGCADTSCSLEGTTSPCTSSPSTSYLVDDFDNVIEVNGGGSIGVARFEYDALGNVIAQQTEAQRTATTPSSLSHTYDRLGRLKATDEIISGTHYVVSDFDYESAGANPPAGCPQPLRTNGRLRRSRDPLFTRWYQYDGEGRVVLEIRLPEGATTCDGALNLGLSYTLNGKISQMVYGHGRIVTYGYGTGALADRETSIAVEKYVPGGLKQTLIDQIKWEPYRGLRSYRMRFDTGSTATVEYEMGAASATMSDCLVGPLAETNDQTGRLRTVRVFTSTGDVYRKTYTWTADQITRIATCYKGDGNAIVEDYSGAASRGYDGVGRLRGVDVPNVLSTGGPMSQVHYGYDARNNITQMSVAGASSYALSYVATPVARMDQLLAATASSDPYNVTKFDYDSDGRTTSIYGENDSSSFPGRSILIDYAGNAAISPGSLTASRSIQKGVAYNYSTTNYWYDNSQRRQAKTYPLNQLTDLFSYDLGHQMLEDRGNVSLTAPSATLFPVDEYIWLGGFPVAIYKALLTKQANGSYVHGTDGTGFCSRLDVVSECGAHFLIADHLPKPVLVLNFRGQITGVGEYDPSGYINRVPFWWSTAHPYTKGVEGPVFMSFKQRELGGMVVQFRNHFTMVDTEQHSTTGAIREGPSIWNDSQSTMFQVLGGYHKGDVWSQWQVGQSVSGWRKMKIGWGTVAGNCLASSGLSCPMPSGQGWSYMGFVHRDYEYKRYDSGAYPYFPPLRFPGQYYDEESDLFENWHRSYYPFVGRYLSPEPLLQSSAYVRRMAERGVSVPAYAYALNNPLRYTDPKGLWTVGIGGQLSMNGLLTSMGVNGGVYVGYTAKHGFSFGVLGGGMAGGGFPPAVSATGFLQVTSADSVCMLKGIGNQSGVSIGEAFTGGLDVVGGLDGNAAARSSDPLDGFSYGGIEVSGGVGVSIVPVEGHSQGTYTGGYDTDTGWTW